VSTPVISRALPDPVAEPTIRVDRAAAILGISTRAVYNAAKEGRFPAIRVGGRVIIPTARFLRFVDLGSSDGGGQ
jgi:excisionase family DNA binding protein